jgi:hypothetical protein
MTGEEEKISICEKYTLTVEEASKYFRIGQKRLRNLIATYPGADYLLTVGNRTLIKRVKFEKFIDSSSCL